LRFVIIEWLKLDLVKPVLVKLDQPLVHQEGVVKHLKLIFPTSIKDIKIQHDELILFEESYGTNVCHNSDLAKLFLLMSPLYELLHESYA
jgi:hypothetical protein